MKRNALPFWVSILILITVACMTGCGGGGGSESGSALVPDGGTVITDSPTSIEGWDAVKQLSPGAVVKVRLNRSQFEVREYDAIVQGFDSNFGENLVICKMLNNVVVGSGDSGSPVLYNGKVIAALCYGLAQGENLIFGARSISDVIALSGDVSNRSSSSRGGSNSRSIAGQQFVPLELVHYSTMKSDQITKPSTGRGGPASVKLIPGMSIAVNELTGAVTAGAIGTVTYIDGDKIYAFGHEYNLNGENATPVTLASVYGVGNGGAAGVVKLATPTEIPVGTLTNDRFSGILIEKSVQAKTYPVSIGVTVDGQNKGEVTVRFAVHNWQNLWYSSESSNFSGLTSWLLTRQVGKVSIGTATGTLRVKYSGLPESVSNIEAPAPDDVNNYPITDIAYETANNISNLLNKVRKEETSPESIKIMTSVSTTSGGMTLKVIGKEGYPLSYDKVNGYILQVGDYQLKAWVSGWSDYDQRFEIVKGANVCSINEQTLTVSQNGTAVMKVVVVNNQTGEEKDLLVNIEGWGGYYQP